MLRSTNCTGRNRTSVMPITSTLQTVDRFLEPCDFFTIDVADQIGIAAAQADFESFTRRHARLIGAIDLPGLSDPIRITEGDLNRVGRKYLAAALRAAGELPVH